uniref:Uncharacterized protein n=1 Tax=Minutocellus polymorphus TaxID=265543 RepID=A0A7S0APY9_9STRA
MAACLCTSQVSHRFNAALRLDFGTSRQVGREKWLASAALGISVSLVVRSRSISVLPADYRNPMASRGNSSAAPTRHARTIGISTKRRGGCNFDRYYSGECQAAFYL